MERSGQRVARSPGRATGEAAGAPSRTRTGMTSRSTDFKAHEVRYWTKELGVTEAQLRAAVREVGTSVAKVRAYLKAKR